MQTSKDTMRLAGRWRTLWKVNRIKWLGVLCQTPQGIRATSDYRVSPQCLSYWSKGLKDGFPRWPRLIWSQSNTTVSKTFNWKISTNYT